jgi:hypothetical protein
MGEAARQRANSMVLSQSQRSGHQFDRLQIDRSAAGFVAVICILLYTAQSSREIELPEEYVSRQKLLAVAVAS